MKITISATNAKKAARAIQNAAIVNAKG